MNLIMQEKKSMIGAIILVGFLLIGLGGYVFVSHRLSEEVAINEDLRLEAATLRATLTRLERSLALLDDLPPIAGANWEKALVDQINQVAEIAGVALKQLNLSLQSGDKEGDLALVSVKLDMEGGEAAQLECVKLLQESVVGFTLDSFNGTIGGVDAYLLNLGDSESPRQMSLSGQVSVDLGAS